MFLQPNADHMLEAIDEETGESMGELCEEVYVKEERIDLISNDREVEIVMWIDGEELSASFGREQLSRSICRELSKKGFTMQDTPENTEALLDYLLESCKAAPKVYEHKQLGFCKVGDETVFLADTVIGLSGADKKAKSKYDGKENVTPRGTKNSWKAIMEQEILGHPNLELALAIGASAPVVHLCQEAGQYTEVPIWGIVGQSSTGKTTALRLMASVYGSPEEGIGLIKDFHATDTAIFAALQGYGMVHILDEATLLDKRDYSSMLYSFSKGEDKLRCDSTGALKERQKFSGNIIISGERSLLEQSSVNLGLHARVVELSLLWTDDEDHARRITTAVRQNYGWAIKPYAKGLLKLRAHPELIRKMFNQELDRLRVAIGYVPGEQERILNMYATVVLSATLFSMALGLKLNIKSIRDLLVQNHIKAPRKSDLAIELYQSILDEVAIHGAHFPTTNGRNMNQFIPADMWGERTTVKSRNGISQNVLWIIGPKFQEFAEKHGFTNYIQFMDELCKQKKLRRYSDGYTAKHRLGTHSPRCYCLYV